MRGGTYPEGINDGLWTNPPDRIPSGSSWSTATTIRAYLNERVTLPHISLEDTRYVVFDGINVDGQDAHRIHATPYGPWDGITLHDHADHVRVQNAEIKNGFMDGVSASASSVGFNEFVNLDVHRAGFQAAAVCDACGWSSPPVASLPGGGGYLYHGMYLSSGNNLVENSRIHDNTGYGLHFYSGKIGGNDHNIARNNVVYNNGSEEAARDGRTSYGIILASGGTNVAYGNEVYGNRGGGIHTAYGCPGCQIFNNVIHDNGSTGILVTDDSGAGVIVENNVVSAQTDGSIYAGPARASGNWCDLPGNGCDVLGTRPPTSLAPVRTCVIGGDTHDCATVTPRDWDK